MVLVCREQMLLGLLHRVCGDAVVFFAAIASGLGSEELVWRRLRRGNLSRQWDDLPSLCHRSRLCCVRILDPWELKSIEAVQML